MFKFGERSRHLLLPIKATSPTKYKIYNIKCILIYTLQASSALAALADVGVPTPCVPVQQESAASLNLKVLHTLFMNKRCIYLFFIIKTNDNSHNLILIHMRLQH